MTYLFLKIRIRNTFLLNQCFINDGLSNAGSTDSKLRIPGMTYFFDHEYIKGQSQFLCKNISYLNSSSGYRKNKRIFFTLVRKQSILKFYRCISPVFEHHNLITELKIYKRKASKLRKKDKAITHA